MILNDLVRLTKKITLAIRSNVALFISFSILTQVSPSAKLTNLSKRMLVFEFTSSIKLLSILWVNHKIHINSIFFRSYINSRFMKSWIQFSPSYSPFGRFSNRYEAISKKPFIIRICHISINSKRLWKVLCY